MHGPIIKLVPWCLITIWATEGKLLQAALSRVILEISQASRTRDRLQVSLGRERGVFRGMGVRAGVLRIGESCHAMVDCSL